MNVRAILLDRLELMGDAGDPRVADLTLEQIDRVLQRGELNVATYVNEVFAEEVLDRALKNLTEP